MSDEKAQILEFDNFYIEKYTTEGGSHFLRLVTRETIDLVVKYVKSATRCLEAKMFDDNGREVIVDINDPDLSSDIAYYQSSILIFKKIPYGEIILQFIIREK